MRFSAVATPQWYLEGILNYGTNGFHKTMTSFATDALSVDMRGRVACVTGANSGIGYCVARAFAERNATVHMVCRNQARGEEARSKVLAETGNEDVYLHVLDVSDFRKVEAFATSFVAANSRLNILVNNAGGILSERTLSKQGNESIMATVLGGSFLLTKLLLPSLEKAAEGARGEVREAQVDYRAKDSGTRPGGAGGGHVINVSSGGMYCVSAHGLAKDLNNVGMEPYDGTLIYALAKRVQITLTEQWAALQLQSSADGKRVRFNSMHPGWVDTPGLAAGMSSFRERQKASLRSSEEGADTVVWLACSEAAAGETGKFWFDRKARRTHMPLAGTRASDTERAALWEAVEQLCTAKS